MTEREMLDKLNGVPQGAKVFVSYLAGRKPTARAIREAERARREGLAMRHFTGTLTEVRTTKKGEAIMTVLADVRDNEQTGAHEHFRSFNPSLGQLLHVEVLELPATGGSV